jgi:hypothetical protein
MLMGGIECCSWGYFPSSRAQPQQWPWPGHCEGRPARPTRGHALMGRNGVMPHYPHPKSTPTSSHAKPVLAGHWPWFCREGARGQAQFPYQQHSIPPIIASSTPKIPSANLLFQPHPPNTEKASSLILLQCFREPRQREPHSQCPTTFDEGPYIEECLQRRWWSHISTAAAAGAVPRALSLRVL